MIFLYFLIYLFLEVYLTIEIGSYLGALFVFSEIIFSAILGVLILINLNALSKELFYDLLTGQISNVEFIGVQLFRIIGAIFLILPGVVCDFVGILMQFEFISKPLSLRLFKNKNTNKTKESEIIEVEVLK